MNEAPRTQPRSHHLNVAIDVIAAAAASCLRQRFRQPRHELGFQHACSGDPALGKLRSEERDRQRGRLVELGRHGSSLELTFPFFEKMKTSTVKTDGD